MRRHAIIYGLLAVVGAVATALATQIQAGRVPIPHDWAWAGPVIVVGLLAISSQLPALRGTPPAAELPSEHVEA